MANIDAPREISNDIELSRIEEGKRRKMEDKANAGNTAVEAAENNPAPVKKSAKAKSAKSQQQKKSTRPPTSEMVTTAITELKERKGSSLQAIKKYIVATYKVDAEKVAPFIRRYLKTAVSSGAVVQTKGKGASGSFKLSTDKAKPKKTKSRHATRSEKPKKAASPSSKRSTHIRVLEKSRKPAPAKKASAGGRKAADNPKKQPAQRETATRSEKTKAAPKSPSRVKKTVKAPAAKTKTPKPKKAAASKTAKVAAKK